MQSIRLGALLLAMAAVSMSGTLASAQQEVDPDHFDQPAQYYVHKPAPTRHQKHANASVASKQSVRHRKSRASV